MSPLLIVALLLFAVLGAPLFAVFGAASMSLFAGLEDTSVTGAAHDVFSEKFADSPLMVTIPLFIFAGYMLAESGTPRRIVELSRAWLGWMPGGLAIVCIGASAFFTTFTGGSGITIVAIGALLYPALRQENYPEKFTLGLVTASGSLGLLFPPSLPLILYGVVGGVLIEKLFLAGIIPGVLTMIALSVYASVTGIREKMPKTPFVLRKALAASWDGKWVILLPVALLGGLLSGVLRIHEAAAFTAFYVLVVEVFIHREISVHRDLPRIIRESVTMFGAILIILATAIGFTSFLIQAQVPQKLLEAMEHVITSPFMFLLTLNIFLLIVGMLMDIFSAIVVVVPLIVPIAKHFGIDPYHVGIVFLLNLEIGYLTPPVGLNLFISSYRFDKPITLLYRAAMPFIGLLVVSLVLTTYVPVFSTFLPGLIDAKEINLDGASGGGGDVPAELPAADGGDDELTLDDLSLDDFELDDGGVEPDEAEPTPNAVAEPTPSDATPADPKKDDDDLSLDDLEAETNE
ncbi:MAG: TRAP transporter large permease subunit [Myxococcales bacterium]|nr:TRAP transporter large permease subunit [Myxococcales bacterium]